MNPTDTTADRVKAQIAAAFSKRAYPDDGKVVVDATGFDPESNALGAAFSGQRWTDVPATQVRSFKDALPLFTPAAFAYFLPAYLLACLEAPEEVDTAFDSVIFALTPPATRKGWQWRFFKDRITLFDRAQAEAVAAFLDLAAQREIEEWAREGKRPPPDRIGRARSYWTGVATETRKGNRK
ncbi:MAG: DUF6714 family protein [Burkholderiales bacterium]